MSKRKIYTRFFRGKDCGWVKLRRGIYDHYHAGLITKVELDLMLALITLAETNSGCVLTCAGELVAFYKGEISLRSVQRGLANLIAQGYISRSFQAGQNLYYTVEINKYEITTGSRKGEFVAVRRSGTPESVAEASPVMSGKGSTSPESVTEARHESCVQSGSCSDAVSDSDTEMTLMQLDDGPPMTNVATIQDGDGDSEGKKSNSKDAAAFPSLTSAVMTVLLPNENRIPDKQADAAHTNPDSHAKLPARLTKVPASHNELQATQTHPDNPTEATPACNPQRSSLPGKAEPFDPLRYVMTNAYPTGPQEDVGEFSALIAADIVWWHWRVSEDPKKYWQSRKANISSPVRLAKVLRTMLSQMDDPEYEFPAWVYDHESVPDPACKLCGGFGSTTVPRMEPMYEGLGFRVEQYCACRQPGRYRWETYEPLKEAA